MDAVTTNLLMLLEYYVRLTESMKERLEAYILNIYCIIITILLLYGWGHINAQYVPTIMWKWSEAHEISATKKSENDVETINSCESLAISMHIYKAI